MRSSLSRLWLLPGLCLLLCLAAPPALPQEYAIAPVPEWVEVPAIPTSSRPASEASDGTHYLLLDTQLRLERGNPVYYRRLAMHAVNQEGVENVAQIQIEFDPSYEQVRLHRLTVWRDGQPASRLQSASVQLLQRERELESLIYDGSKTVSIFVEDVRIGDVFEYAYSIAGSNPIFADRSFGSIRLQWGIPVDRVHTRVLLPPGREPQFEGLDSDLQRQTLADGWQVWRWLQEPMPALSIEDDAPAWYQPHLRLRWSEYADWKAVVDWALPLYARPAQPPAELRTVAAGIAEQHAQAPERMLAALRWVQSEIRYLGIELGTGSHAPSPPAQVLERRYGDCKDKTLLLLSLLDQLGVQAEPALVHTNLRRGVAERQPSPGQFNHVLVHARIDGRSYWIDPTRSEQAGDADSLYQPDYGVALPIAADSGELRTMFPERAPNKRTITHKIDSQAGLDSAAKLTITTLSEGSFAEDSRSEFASSNHEEVRKHYLNYYANYYRGIRSAAPLDVASLDQSNQLRLVEHYEIDDFWIHDKEEGRRTASIEAPDIRSYLEAPSTLLRQAPLAIAHPLEVVQELEVLLPSKWPDDVSEHVVEDPHFRFVRQVRSKGDRLQITDRFQSLSDHVPGELVASYAAKLAEARDLLGYELYRYDQAPAAEAAARQWQPTVLFFAVLVLVVCGSLAMRLYRYDPAPHPAEPVAGLTGLGGWLVLPMLGLLLLPVAVVILILAGADALTDPGWTRLTAVGGEAYQPQWMWALLAELGGYLALGVFGLLLLVLLFQRRSSLPRLYIGFLILSVLLSALALWPLTQLSGVDDELIKESWRALIGDIGALLIWGSYFHVSVRVRSTFRRRLGERGTATAPPTPSPEPQPVG